MNKKLMKQMGFGVEIAKVENKLCPFCNEPINEANFRNTLSLKEYTISGLCQNCQDEIFKDSIL